MCDRSDEGSIDFSNHALHTDLHEAIRKPHKQNMTQVTLNGKRLIHTTKLLLFLGQISIPPFKAACRIIKECKRQ